MVLDLVRCPSCGADVKPETTWQVVSPLPDAEGRITITVMGTFTCPSCGHKWKGKVSSIKVGPEGEVSFGEERKKRTSKEKKSKGSEYTGKVIELDISEILSEEE
ncbi:MAG: hypothetical protein B7O98_02095 [Zestosphaera tikiterensis]|uniref:Chromatin protein Cren7 n=1 Tax=Zestosphaera tikiterensis TaxID=1973259 RepID=A0A2R7Y6U7_9CREN|nr:MAG: hypothetical protein B7O98_02095 [Zestosphaera tikiterensis]